MTKDANQKSAAEREQQQNEAIQEEIEEWHKSGIDPSGITIHGFFLDVQVRTILTYLIDHGFINQDKLNELYRTKLLEELKGQREVLAPAVAQAKIRSEIELPPGVIDGRNRFER